MSNPNKGEVAFEADGKRYTMRFSVNALCMLEQETGRGFPKLVEDLANIEKVSLTLLRQLLWAALQEEHKGITVMQAGELIAAAGGMNVILNKITDAIQLAFPEPQGGNSSRPLAKPMRQPTGLPA